MVETRKSIKQKYSKIFEKGHFFEGGEMEGTKT